MFKLDKKEVFSFRKYKGYGLASAVIAAFFFASSVSADVVNNGDGTTTLSNDKASVVVDTSKFKEDNTKTATELFNEGSYDAETVTTGKESVAVESKTTVKYQTEEGEQIDEDVVKTTSETKELDYKVTGKSGKEYTGDNSATSTVNADLEKKDLIEKDGERYKYLRTETSAGGESVLTETAFNDVNVKASVQGMHNNDGSVKYDKIENGTRVWVLEELEDGSYGKYALIENAQNLNDDQIREAAKTATSKFSKAEVEKLGGIKDTDFIVVYETNTYAARKQSSVQYGKDFYYNQTASSSNLYKEYLDEIYKVGLDGLEKRDDKYYYNGKEVATIEDFKKNPTSGVDGQIDGYYTDTENKYYFDSLSNYVVPTTYYDVLSDFLIKHPDSPIFANRHDNVFWEPEEYKYFAESFVARLIATSFNKKYNLTVDTENFTDKPIETKAENSRPTEKKTYSFVKTELNGDEESYGASVFNNADDMWKQEIGLSYSEENIEKVRNWIKGSQSLNGWTIEDPFDGKDASEVSKEEYTNAVFDQISSTYWTTMKDNFTPEQIRELRSKFGASSFMIVGSSITINRDEGKEPSYSLTGTAPTVYRNSLGVVTENTETFTYHDVITPLRAYRLNADTNAVRHVYEKVKRGSVIATHKDTEGNELLPQESIKMNDFDGEEYTTSSKEIPVKVVKDTTPEGFTRTTTTTYQLVENPSNKDGQVIGGETITVPYVYRPVHDIRINGSVVATYSDEEGNKLADDVNVKTDAPEREAYRTEAKTIRPIYDVETVNGLTKTTITRYELVQTPDNKDGNVVGNQTIVVPYVYRKVVTVEIKGSVIATYKDEEGTILASEEKVITNQNAGTYYAAAAKQIQASASSKITENGREVTVVTYELIKTPDNETGEVVGGETLVVPYVYRKVENVRLVPNNPPVVEDEVLKVTRFYTDQGEELQSDVTGFEDAPKIIGNYQFTGTTETNEAGDVQTHIYTKIVTEIPNEAPKVELIDAEVTRYMLEDRETEIADWKPGLHLAENIIGQYQFTGVTDVDTDGFVRTHIYKLIETDIPGDAPIVEIPSVKVTRFHSNTGEELQSDVTGFEDAPKMIGDYQFTGITETNELGDVQTHIYTKIVTEIPNDAPKYELPEVKVTRFVDGDGNELKSFENGLQEPVKQIGEYQYTGSSHYNDSKDVLTHVYSKVVTEIPRESLVLDKIEYKMTRYVDEQGQELTLFDFGLRGPKAIEDYVFTGRTDSNEAGDVLTHVYRKIVVETKIPGDAPVVEIPELKVTRYVNEEGEEIKESEAGLIEAPNVIGEYEFTGKTEFNDGKDVQTHIYKLVVKPVIPDIPEYKKPEIPRTLEPKKPETPRILEPKKPETPQPEAPKPIETHKSNDSQTIVVKSSEQSRFVTNELPKTGEANSKLALIGASLLTSLGLIGFVKRKREN